MTRHNLSTALAAAAALFAMAALTSGARAQNPFEPAPLDALDTLSGASTGPTNPFGNPAPAGGNPFGPPPGGGGANPFGPPPDGGANPFGPPAGGSPFGDPGVAAGGGPFGPPAGGAFGDPGAGSPFGGGAGAPAPGGDSFGGTGGDGFGGDQVLQLPPLPQSTRVLVGERIYCPVTGRLIEDARWQRVWAREAQSHFYDDGTHGDAVANDTFYTRITEREDETSSVAWRLLHQNRDMIDLASRMEPHVFFKLAATSTASGSRLPNTIDKERDQDARVLEWANKFLRPYRKDPNNDLSEFFKPYIPQPPLPPDTPPPAGFIAPERSETTFEAGQDNRDTFDRFLDTGGGLLPDPQNPQTGIPSNPAASSSYFATN